MMGRRHDAGDERVELRGLATGWDAGRTERLLTSVHGRLARRRRVWRAAVASGGVACAAALTLYAVRADRTPARAPAETAARDLPPATAPVDGVLRLRDGSEVRLDRSTSEVRVLEETATRVRVELVRGSGRYVVVPNPARAFEVHAGRVTVSVLGTEFVVERRGDATWVDVTRGKVAVSSEDGAPRALLVGGEHDLFPRTRAPAPAVAGAEDDTRSDARSSADTSRTPAQRATQSYRAQVARRDYRGAYAELARNPTLAGDTVEELLVAADVARLSDHPAEAVPYLRRILRDHARDERAPMAAFTLGRTLSGLGRPREAMPLFARVRTDWPRSPLGEDALVREAEAAAALGDIPVAARLAAEYDRAYPHGQRRAEVRRYARLE